MSETKKIDFIENSDFNRWLEENYQVRIEEYEYPSSEVLYNTNYEDYVEALNRYTTDPRIEFSRIKDKFPLPIAYYFYQANNNYQNDHHRLDLLKSCWESIVFFLFGLVVAEARHKKLPIKDIGIAWKTFWSDRLFDKLTIIENIIDHTTKSGIVFECTKLIPISTLADIKTLNQERNGFAHASARTTVQQQELYKTLSPLLMDVLRSLIGLENITILRYHSSETPLIPRCEIFNGSSIEGRKEGVILKKESYIEILDHWNASSIFAKINDRIFCLSPFIHFVQEPHETNAVLCFFKKKTSAGKYLFEVVSKAQNKEFDKNCFTEMETQLRGLVMP
jgi:hypothetical protein